MCSRKLTSSPGLIACLVPVLVQFLLRYICFCDSRNWTLGLAHVRQMLCCWARSLSLYCFEVQFLEIGALTSLMRFWGRLMEKSYLFSLGLLVPLNHTNRRASTGLHFAFFFLLRRSYNERSLSIKLYSGCVINIFSFLVLNTIKLEKPT